ncbi:MAG: response regulator [Acidobacteria bacterium]|nr:response regulator [Acidobacteriota bacterium]
MAEQILIIDDDVKLAEMLGEYLGERGYEVMVSHTVAAGLATLDRCRCDALILDVMLPDGDGLDICRRVRSDSDIPILMLTARGEETDRIVGLEIGADDYLPKPFNPRELLARLKAILRRRAGATGGARHALRFGRLEIDAAARVVRVDGEERSLTSYQFDLLVAMACHAGRVMSREALMEKVRGEELEAFDRSIDVHVSRIRAAIEDDPKRPRRILTIRGAGYVFARKQDEERSP